MKNIFLYASKHLLFCFLFQFLFWIGLFILLPSSIHGLNYDKNFSELFYKLKQIIGLNPGDIFIFVASGIVIRTLLIFTLSFPTVYCIYMRNWKKRVPKNAAIFFITTVFILSYLSFCISWCPTLFVDLLKFTSVFIYEGYLLYPFSLIWIFLILVTWYYVSRPVSRLGASLILVLIVLPYVVFVSEKTYPSSMNLNLPEKSILLILADSFRADHMNTSITPHLIEIKMKMKGVALKGIVTPSESTVTSVAALFTGKMPHESGVKSSYSKPLDFSKDSLIYDLKLKGYCTIGISYYSENSITRNEYGFDIKRNMLSDYSYKYLSYFLLKRDPLLIAALAFDSIYNFTPKIVKSSYDFFSGAPSVLKILKDLKKRKESCTGKPIFAFLLFQEPHFEYPVTFPYYLDIPFEQRRYSVLSDYYSNENKKSVIKYISKFYSNSIKQVDIGVSKLILDNFVDSKDEDKTIIFSSDHGEYLGEGENYLHAETLGPVSGGMMPFLVFGRGRTLYEKLGETIIQNTELRRDINLIASSSELKKRPRQVYLYRESEIWPWGDSLKMDFDRVHYPVSWEGLLEYSANGTLVLADQYGPITEYAKHRQWIIGNDTYDIIPQDNNKHLLKKNNKIITRKQLPKIISDMLIQQVPKLYEDLKGI